MLLDVHGAAAFVTAQLMVWYAPSFLSGTSLSTGAAVRICEPVWILSSLSDHGSTRCEKPLQSALGLLSFLCNFSHALTRAEHHCRPRLGTTHCGAKALLDAEGICAPIVFALSTLLCC